MKYNVQECYGARLRRLSRIMDGYYRPHLKEYNITENQMTILFVLSKTGEIEQGVIGQKLYLQRSTISRNAKLLENRGLLSRSSDYRPSIALTSQGQSLVDILLPQWEKSMAELNRLLGGDGVKSIALLEQKLK